MAVFDLFDIGFENLFEQLRIGAVNGEAQSLAQEVIGFVFGVFFEGQHSFASGAFGVPHHLADDFVGVVQGEHERLFEDVSEAQNTRQGKIDQKRTGGASNHHRDRRQVDKTTQTATQYN